MNSSASKHAKTFVVNKFGIGNDKVRHFRVESRKRTTTIPSRIANELGIQYLDALVLARNFHVLGCNIPNVRVKQY